MNKKRLPVVAIDFDGTVVENRFPKIGKLKPGFKRAFKLLKNCGCVLVLWTCREGKHLDEVIKFLRKEGINFDYINNNVEFTYWTPRKVFADLYVDDSSLYWEDKHWMDIAYDIISKLYQRGFKIVDRGRRH